MKTDKKYNFLQDIRIGKKVVHNRIVVPPMVEFGVIEEDGFVHDRHLKHYKLFAQGGAGIVTTEAFAVLDPNDGRHTLHLYSDKFIPGLTKLVTVIKSCGALVFVQINNRRAAISEGRVFDDITVDEIEEIKQGFLDAAVRVWKSGADGVEIHAAHGFFLNQSFENNHRDFLYGGNLDERMGLIVEIIRAVRERTDNDFIISVRLGYEDEKSLVRAACILEDAGADILSISRGCSLREDPMNEEIPDGFIYDRKVYLASLVKEKVNIPVTCVGKIKTASEVDEILTLGYADMVALGREHLTDPYWTREVLEDNNPVLCKQCRKCLWYIDGKYCPGRKEWQKQRTDCRII